MLPRMFRRCLATRPTLLKTPPRETFVRFESTLPAYANFVDHQQPTVDLPSLYRKFPNAEGFLRICRQYNLSEQILAGVVEKVPEITNYEPSRISNNIQQFLSLGFESVSIATIVQNYPRVLDYEANDITDTFETWRSGNLHERFLRKLFVEHSWLLSVENEQVRVRLNRIFYLMRHKINRITSLLLTSPTIMLGNWDEVEDKFTYCLKEMRYLEKEISRSTALAQSMSRIKLRHMFLERAGVYVRPGLKDLPGMNPHKNPSLANIVDPDDEQFAVNTAQVSYAEYRVFLKLMRYEREDEEENAMDDPKDQKRDSEFDDVIK